jgi:hypothetical protein
MKDPTRLVDLSSDHQVVTLLRAGATEQPSDGALQRTLRAAAVGGSIAASSVAAAAGPAQTAASSAGVAGSSVAGSSVAAGSTASSGLGVGASMATGAKVGGMAQVANATLAVKVGSAAGLMKWVGVGVVGAASVTYAPEAVEWVRTTEFGGSHAAKVASPAAKVASPAAAELPDGAHAVAAVQAATAPTTARELTVAPASPRVEALRAPTSPRVEAVRAPAFTPLNTQARAALGPAATPSVSDSPSRSTDSFTAEVRLVEASRNALRAGDPARSFSLLSAYETQYPRLQLRPEVLRLRLEALEQMGRTDAARTVAREILRLGATGTHAERARTLLNQ